MSDKELKAAEIIPRVIAGELTSVDAAKVDSATAKEAEVAGAVATSAPQLPVLPVAGPTVHLRKVRLEQVVACYGQSLCRKDAAASLSHAAMAVEAGVVVQDRLVREVTEEMAALAAAV